MLQDFTMPKIISEIPVWLQNREIWFSQIREAKVEQFNPFERLWMVKIDDN